AGAVFGEARYRDVGHATATCVGLHLFPSQLQGSRRIDLVDEAKPLVSFQPSREGHQHALCPHPRFRSHHVDGRFSCLFIPGGNCRRFGFLGRFHHAFTFLGPSASPALPGFITTMDPLTPSRLSPPQRYLHLSHAPFRSFPLQPHPNRRASSFGNPWTVTRSPLSRQASPLPSRLARLTCRIEFTLVRDRSSASGCSPPRLAATQLPSTAPRSLPPGR